MIMPSKHINFSQSLLGLGSYLLTKLDKPKSIDDIWEEYQFDYENGSYISKHSFDNIVMTFIFLYGVNAIKQEKGIISKCN
ncbi:MAG: ABC-three component system middle component 6 [Marinifilaceae bacterium]